MRPPNKPIDAKRQGRARAQALREAPEKGYDRPQRGQAGGDFGPSIVAMPRGLAASDPAVVATAEGRILAQFGQSGRQHVASLSNPGTDSFERLARQALSALRSEPAGKTPREMTLRSLERLSAQGDSPRDGARAMRDATDALMERLAPALGLQAKGVPVRLDDAATARAKASARAVFEAGAIYID